MRAMSPPLNIVESTFKRGTVASTVQSASALIVHSQEKCRIRMNGADYAAVRSFVSAGGLLVGNVVNLAPELFCAAVAGVPFVDLMTTMCDPSIPLTTEEWEEWGEGGEGRP